ncbi:hypothetical protein, partial [Mycobacterium colombiense]|uniref:hypothetical protein n=1 Tax=Mycobacterium colombiense TaxID=339268 RepID=UPI001C4BCAA9
MRPAWAAERAAWAAEGVAQCQGGPYAGPPTGPADLSCISQPADPVCAGGPYSLPPAQPPMA